MSRLTPRLILVASLLGACGGGSSDGGPEPSPSPSPPPAAAVGPWALDLARGERLYGELCQGCHQANGAGGYGPALTNTASCPPCESFHSLWERIDEAMPLRNPGECVDDCARDIAAWIINGFSTVPGCSVEFRYDSIAGDAFAATVSIANFSGRTVPDWRLGFTLDDGQRRGGGQAAGRQPADCQRQRAEFCPRRPPWRSAWCPG